MSKLTNFHFFDLNGYLDFTNAENQLIRRDAVDPLPVTKISTKTYKSGYLFKRHWMNMFRQIARSPL